MRACREVSKGSRYAINALFDKPLPIRPDPDLQFGLAPCIWYNNTTGIRLSTSSEVEQLIELLESKPECAESLFFHHTVKFISKISDNQDEVRRRFELFHQFLSEYGRLIRRCVYVTYGGHPHCDRVLQYLFQLIPDLESVAVMKMGLLTPWEDLHDMGWLLQRREALPPLPHLVSINLFEEHAPALADLILISYGHQIENIYCGFSVIRSCPYFQGPLRQYSLQNLRELTIFDGFGSSALLERLLQFDLNNLQVLSLDYTEAGPRARALQSILKVIDRFQGSLSELRLPLWLFRGDGEFVTDDAFRRHLAASSQVPLIKVKKLGVSLDVLGFSASPLLFRKFPLLECLAVKNYDALLGHDNQIIMQMLQNINPLWDLVGSLRKIIVERAYSRHREFYRS